MAVARSRLDVARAAELRMYGDALVAGVEGGVLFVLDRDLRIHMATGESLTSLGLAPASIERKLAADVLPSWEVIAASCKGALKSETATFSFRRDDVPYSVHVAPLVDQGETIGVLVSARTLIEEERLTSVIDARDAAARDSERLLATAFDHAPVGMSIVDLEGRWLRLNDAYAWMLGYDREELLTIDPSLVTHPDDLQEDTTWAARAAAGEVDSLERDRRCIARDGSIVWVHARSELLRDDHEQPTCVVSMLQDITKRREADEAVRTSERYLRSILDTTPEPLFVQDLSYRYQMVNVAFEERVGLPRAQILGRRDDELLPDEAVAVNRHSFDLVLKTGDVVKRDDVVRVDGHARDYSTVKFPLRDADGVIYAVCGTFNDITDRKRDEAVLRDRIVWTDLIHNAIAQDRLILHAQPILNLATGEIDQAELLVRMRGTHGAPRLMPPGEFIPQAERFGLIGAIDRWVLGEALKVAKDHCVEVNLSGATISDCAQVDEIERMVRESGAPPEHIIFEITESAVAENMDHARDFATRLRALGCAFALDDFGVGYGAFTYLRNLPVDFLKIDIAFVRDLVDNEGDRQVVHAMVSVARDFGIKTIAEGVEDQATLELLGLMGVDHAQGYWIARPGPIDDLWPSTSPARTPR
ncbi:MAG: EAL domain-containing protein [Solirubrobacteraceae bacterium]|nr:EAL domain-containing protein [Solirubrobacteraceae bacterium]